jgi:hypothetical protein
MTRRPMVVSGPQELGVPAAPSDSRPSDRAADGVSPVPASIPNADLLRMDYINSLPQPFVGLFYGGDEWPIHDIDVETGLLRIDVCGLLQVKHIGDVRSFRDADGGIHDADDFYSESSQ